MTKLLRSRPARACTSAIGRYWSWLKSSSRGHISLTGFCTTIATCTAWLMKSTSALRPSPPPRFVTWIVTWSGVRFTIVATSASADLADWVGAQTSQRTPGT